MKKKGVLSQTSIHIMLIIFMGIIIGLMLQSNYTLEQAMQKERRAMDRKERSNALGYELQDVSDYMTEQARKYILTHDYTYSMNYWTEVNKTKRRESILEALKELDLLEEEQWLLKAAKKSSDELISIENEAMKHHALEQLFNEDYRVKKEIIRTYIQQFQSMINLRMAREVKQARSATEQEMEKQKVNELIAGLVCMLSAMVVYVFTIKPVLNYARQLEKNEEEKLNPHGTKEIYRLGKDIEQMYQRMSSAIKAKGEYLAVMSHEIRTPLHSMLGYTDLLEETVLDNQQKEYVTYLEHATKSLLRLVSNILDYEKIGNEKYQIEEEHFALRQLEKFIRDNFETTCQKKQLKLYIEREEEEEAELLGDYTKIKQIINNLVGNSIKFTDKGYIKISLQRSGEGLEQSLEMGIEDTGIGIDKKNYKAIFTPYKQLHQAERRDKEGTGLGLSICKEIVRCLNGQIKVESELGQGTLFKIQLPIQVEQTQRQQEEGTTVTLEEWEEIKQVFINYVEDGDFEVVGYFEKYHQVFSYYLNAQQLSVIEESIRTFEFERIMEVWQNDTF